MRWRWRSGWSYFFLFRLGDDKPEELECAVGRKRRTTLSIIEFASIGQDPDGP